MGNQCSDAQPTEEPAEQTPPTRLPSSTRPSEVGFLRAENPQVCATAVDREHRSSVDGCSPPPLFSGSSDVSSAAARTPSVQRRTSGAVSMPREPFGVGCAQRPVLTAQPVPHTTASKKTGEAPVSYKALFKETMERVRAAQATRRAAERAAPLGPVQLLGSAPEPASNSKVSNGAETSIDNPLRQREHSSERQNSWGGGSNALRTGTAGTRKSSVDQQQRESNQVATNPLARSDMAIRFSDSTSSSSKESSCSVSSGTDPLGRASPGIVRRRKTPGMARKAVGVRWSAHSSRSSSGEGSVSSGSGLPRNAERPLGGDAFGSASCSSASSPTPTPTMSRASSVSRSSAH